MEVAVHVDVVVDREAPLEEAVGVDYKVGAHPHEGLGDTHVHRELAPYDGVALHVQVSADVEVAVHVDVIVDREAPLEEAVGVNYKVGAHPHEGLCDTHVHRELAPYDGVA